MDIKIEDQRQFKQCIEEQGIDRLIPWIELAFKADPLPWQIWPADRPCRTPDGYFRYAADVGCDDLAKLIAAYKGENYSLVRALRAATAEGELLIADENAGGRGKLHSDTMEFKQGNTVPHLLRRLARERPDILAEYERGEHATPTAAARAAGFKVDTPPPTTTNWCGPPAARRGWSRSQTA